MIIEEHKVAKDEAISDDEDGEPSESSDALRHAKGKMKMASS